MLKIYGLKSPDENWAKMRAVYDSCIKANVDLPKEVDDYFQGEEPDEAGIKIRIKTKNATNKSLNIDINDIPTGIEYLHVVID